MNSRDSTTAAMLHTDGDGWIGIMSQWVAWKVLHLPRFLSDEGTPQWLWRRGRRAPKGLKAIAGIGYKRSSDHARVLCQRWEIPYIALEDGFLRSSSLGVQGDTPMSMVVDPIGIHYLADRPSLLENILQNPEDISSQELDIARALVDIMRTSGIGKYNHAPDLSPTDELGQKRPLVLVVDQTFGDFSIPGGGLSESDFIRMLDCALMENPDADVRVRIHPDCVAGYKKSCLLEAAQRRGVSIESRVVSWSSFVKRARRVYVGTSQAGLEALIEGVAVTCFGLPFYAGWGLTDDRMPLPRRQARPTLLQLVAAAYIRYCRYVDPLTGERTDVLTVARQLALQKKRDSAFAGTLAVLGVKQGERRMVRRFLDSRWGQLRFIDDVTRALPILAAEGGRLVVHAGREPESLSSQAMAAQVPIWRIAQGMLEACGPWGADGPAVSLLLHRNSVDCHTDRDLISSLLSTVLDSNALQEAANLRQRITERMEINDSSLRRTVQPRARSGQRCILVPGQASLKRGQAGLHTDLQLLQRVRAEAPDAWIIYLRHPDSKTSTQEALLHANHIENHPYCSSLYGQADAVHTLTSMVGFVALLHRIPVITYGVPFYAGWGLTQDHAPLAPRGRQLSLDHLVACALIHYPLYCNPYRNLPCVPEHAVNLLRPGVFRRASERTRMNIPANYLRLMLGLNRTNAPAHQ